MRVPETWLVRDAVRGPGRVAAPGILSVVLVALAGSTPGATAGCSSCSGSSAGSTRGTRTAPRTTLDRTPWSNELPKDAKMPPELAGLVVEAASEMRAAQERVRAAGEVAIGALQELERCEGRPIMPTTRPWR